MSEMVRTHIVVPRDLLEEIDAFCGKKRKRSPFIVEAAREKLARERFLKVIDETAGAWRDKNHPDLNTYQDVHNYLRKIRGSFKKRLERIYGQISC